MVLFIYIQQVFEWVMTYELIISKQTLIKYFFKFQNICFFLFYKFCCFFETQSVFTYTLVIMCHRVCWSVLGGYRVGILVFYRIYNSAKTENMCVFFGFLFTTNDHFYTQKIVYFFLCAPVNMGLFQRVC